MAPSLTLPRLLPAVAIACFLFGLFSSLHGAESGPKAFDLPADVAEVSLRKYSNQSGVEVVFASTAAGKVRTNAVKGSFTSEEALEKLIAGTGLTIERAAKSGALMVIAAPNAARAATGNDRPGKDDPMGRPLKLETFEVMETKLLNMDKPRSRDDEQPYVIFGRDTIERSGATSIDDFLKTRLSMNTSAAIPAQNGRDTLNGNNSQINLRGLGTNQTLVLIDGHRANLAMTGQTSGTTQADLNGIPLAAIERIEVLPTTASGIYGGGATGGVVNVILRRDYIGVEMKATYENTFDTDAAIRRLDLAGGFTLENGKTNVLFSASYSDSNELLIQDRNFAAQGRARVFANNPSLLLGGATSALGSTTNIRSTNGSNLTLRSSLGGASLNSPFTFVPLGYRGVTSDGGAGLVVGAGSFNLALSNSSQNSAATAGGRASMISAPVTESAMLTARRQFSSRFQAFLELSAANNSSHFGYSPTTLTFNVPVNAPSNPFGQAVTVNVPINSITGESFTAIYSRRLVAGGILKLPAEWTAEADLTLGRARFFNSNPDQLLPAATTDVTGGVIDIFKAPDLYSDDFLKYVPAPAYAGPYRSNQINGVLRASGPVASLPAGKLVVSALIEYGREKLRDTYTFSTRTGTGNFQPSRSQQVWSTYIESKIPLVTAGQQIPGFHTLEMQLAGRFDDFTVDGVTSAIPIGSTATLQRRRNKNQSTNPTAGLRWSPVEDLVLRASYGTGFLPPTVQQIVPAAPTTVTYTVTDPQRGNAVVGAVQNTGGGNPDLRPEESTSWSAGAIYQPRGIPRLRVSLDYTHIQKTDNITTVSSAIVQSLLTGGIFPERFTRGPLLPGDPFPVGPITAINATTLNLAQAEVEAYDLALDYSFEYLNWGRWDLFTTGTMQTHYKTQLSPDAPVVENVGINNLSTSIPLKWKGNVGLLWHRGPWSAGWTMRYIDSYLVRDPSVASNAPFILAQGNGGRVPSQVFHDVMTRFHLPKAKHSDVNN